jgi:endonuclease/exonuclease/phosphatase family metal-dependent hydrolase
MKHGKITKSTARGLKELRKRIARKPIEPSKLDETINLATWNIREFGRRKRMDRSIHYIAEIINQFDLVAVTEVRDNLADLSRVLKVLGPFWKAVFSDYDTDAGGNRERVAYVYDKRAVAFTGLAAEAEGPRKKKGGEYLPKLSWWRKPYMASFRAGSFDFVIITCHIRWGKGAAARKAPLKLLAEWVAKRRKDKHVYDKDFIVMGDFNIPKVEKDELYEILTSKGLKMPESIKGVHGTNLARKKRYDQILHSPKLKKMFTNVGGSVDFFSPDFESLYKGVNKTKRELTYELSDHLPLWVQVNVDNEDAELDQIIKMK